MPKKDHPNITFQDVLFDVKSGVNCIHRNLICAFLDIAFLMYTIKPWRALASREAGVKWWWWGGGSGGVGG